MSQKKRRRPVHLHVMVSEEELALIRERMAEAGVRNLGAYVRKMALNGYVLHVEHLRRHLPGGDQGPPAGL